jgi:CHAT domain-containing protein
MALNNPKTRPQRLAYALCCVGLWGLTSLSSWAQMGLGGSMGSMNQMGGMGGMPMEEPEGDLTPSLTPPPMPAPGETGMQAYQAYGRLRVHYADIGQLQQAIEMAKIQLSLATGPGQEHGPLMSIISMLTTLHRDDEAKKYLAQMEQVMGRLRNARAWEQRRFAWQAGLARVRAALDMRYGRLESAQQGFASCVTSLNQAMAAEPNREVGGMYVECSRGLINAFMATGQLAQAGQAGDQLRRVADRLMQSQSRPLLRIRVNQALAQIAVEQGKTTQARALLTQTLQGLENTPSIRVAGMYRQLALLEMLQTQWSQALAWHIKRRDLLQGMGDARGQLGVASVEYGYTLLRLGRTAEALEMMQRIVQVRGRSDDKQSLAVQEARAFLGLALAADGQRDAAYRELKVSIPAILAIIKGERSSNESGVLRTTRLNWLLEGYIDVLGQLAQAGDTQAMDEAFRMADLARGSAVQRALAASAARSNIQDPELAALARREQDLQHEAGNLSDAIGDLLARGRVAESDQIVADMRRNLDAIKTQLQQAQATIEKKFPNYASLLDPQPLGMREVQKLLRPGEALVAVYAGAQRTYVWAMTMNAPPRFSVTSLSRAQMDQQVATLRVALDPATQLAGKPQPFPYGVSHALYEQLLAPLKDSWGNASSLMLIPHGSLGQLPLGVLLTEPFSAAPSKVLFEEMAGAPWLMRQWSASQLPSALALAALRTQPNKRPATRPFLGVGDPVFTRIGASSVAANKTQQRAGARPAVSGTNTAPDLAPPIDFGLLPPLPDTAQEINEVADILRAEPGRDVYLQQRASEAQVKAMNLEDYRVLMFATHGLMSGEMPGVFQPALALTNPNVTGESEDGMLTMEEILSLKLNADWVVLSACNTAAGDGQSSESVSGLGRAFFYAGAKALLVTNWSVETESARMLTTQTFKNMAAQPSLTRAKALQQSAQQLMGIKNKDFSYAHPMFWAPYAIIGDGGTQ